MLSFLYNFLSTAPPRLSSSDLLYNVLLELCFVLRFCFVFAGVGIVLRFLFLGVCGGFLLWGFLFILIFETRSHHVALAGLELRDPPVSASHVLGLKMWTSSHLAQKHVSPATMNWFWLKLSNLVLGDGGGGSPENSFPQSLTAFIFSSLQERVFLTSPLPALRLLPYAYYSCAARELPANVCLPPPACSCLWVLPPLPF